MILLYDKRNTKFDLTLPVASKQARKQQQQQCDVRRLIFAASFHFKGQIEELSGVP